MLCFHLVHGIASKQIWLIFGQYVLFPGVCCMVRNIWRFILKIIVIVHHFGESVSKSPAIEHLANAPSNIWQMPSTDLKGVHFIWSTTISRCCTMVMTFFQAGVSREISLGCFNIVGTQTPVEQFLLDRSEFPHRMPHVFMGKKGSLVTRSYHYLSSDFALHFSDWEIAHLLWCGLTLEVS